MDIASVIAGLSAIVMPIIEVLKQLVLRKAQAKYDWTEETYSGVVILVSLVVSLGVVGSVTLSGGAFPFLPAIGLNIDVPFLNWLLGGIAVALGNQGWHILVDAAMGLKGIITSLSDGLAGIAALRAVQVEAVAPKAASKDAPISR